MTPTHTHAVATVHYTSVCLFPAHCCRGSKARTHVLLVKTGGLQAWIVLAIKAHWRTPGQLCTLSSKDDFTSQVPIQHHYDGVLLEQHTSTRDSPNSTANQVLAVEPVEQTPSGQNCHNTLVPGSQTAPVGLPFKMIYSAHDQIPCLPRPPPPKTHPGAVGSKHIQHSPSIRSLTSLISDQSRPVTAQPTRPADCSTQVLLADKHGSVQPVRCLIRCCHPWSTACCGPTWAPSAPA